MRLRTSLAGVLALIVALSGCSMMGRGGGHDSRDAARDRELTLHVINENFYDATIYAVWGGYRQRLGVVVGQGEDTFRFRWAPPELSVEIRLLAVGSTMTHSLPVDEGDILELRVQPDLHRRIPPLGS
ncbi:MAG: hypothetical protein JSW71_04385 [Gemmatimonadota bacterium]|nr:MAG: hypothetical protein JSW71_04385 [Gemmatimonadota bacterium]